MELLACLQKGTNPNVIDLISRTVDVNIQDENDWTPLHWACQDNKKDVAERLLDCGAFPNTVDKFGCSPLMLAAFNGHAELVKLLCERRGISISLVCMILIDQKADVNTEDNAGDTPLIIACRKKYADLVTVLCELGAQVWLTNNSDRSAFDISEDSGFEDGMLILERALKQNPRPVLTDEAIRRIYLSTKCGR
eukprot:GEMP01105162.1.p1 GENE.GEMP01105162.1~~GEMP01105162.1.p1  ORF type:complete len:194 (+),score=26.22 GEMP01105162.1:61-642(+)